ncbi:hypothetical protein O3P69_011457 [Scylla paramamosain]|uniref:Uncharacterized protein n=1 Tax=Scylla paramamosain TaxID=85552 RepID=A0AAW0T6R1_SCYPA
MRRGADMDQDGKLPPWRAPGGYCEPLRQMCCRPRRLSEVETLWRNCCFLMVRIVTGRSGVCAKENLDVLFTSLFRYRIHDEDALLW